MPNGMFIVITKQNKMSMRLFYSLLFILLTNFFFAQDFSGKYYKKIESVSKELIEYTIVIKNNNNYEIKIHRILNASNNTDEYFEGKGEWKKVKTKIIFYPEISGSANEIDLTGVTARFDIKNQNTLLFYSKQKMKWELNVGMNKQL